MNHRNRFRWIWMEPPTVLANASVVSQADRHTNKVLEEPEESELEE